MTRIGYARVSTNDQHPEAQAERLYASGCDPVFTDKGWSGAKASRPQWDKLLENLAPGDELVCVKLDRIGRSVADLLNVVGKLQAAEVDLVVLDQAIDTSTPAGKLLFHVIAAIAEFERGLIIERTRDGQASVRRAGNLRRSLGGTPVLGFREGADGAGDWELDPAASEWLAEAAERVVNGEKVEAVHRALPVMHDATGRVVNAKMLRAALQRPASAGLIKVGDGWLTAGVSAPLDEPVFNRLAVLFGSRKLGRPVDTGAYWLGPKLRCAKCGNQLSGEKVSGTPYYKCKNPHKGLQAKPCHGVSIQAGDVHKRVAIFMEEWSKSPRALLAAARSPETGSRRAELEARMAETQEMLADLEAKRIRRHISPARYAELAAEAVSAIDADAAELTELERVEAEPGIPPVIDWEAMTSAERLRTLEEAIQLPLVVQPGNGGARALSAADRIDLVPAW